jgi:hypothetical protein
MKIFQKIKIIFYTELLLFPYITYGQFTPGRAVLPNPLGSQVNTLAEFIDKILKVVVQFGAVICVFFLIYSGFLFVKASGNEEKLGAAKKTFNWTCLGIMILLGAQVIGAIISGTINQIQTTTP